LTSSRSGQLVAAIRRLRSASCASVAWKVNGRIDVSPASPAAAAGPECPGFAVTVTPGAAWAGAAACAPEPVETGCEGSAWAGGASTRIAAAPATAELRKRTGLPFVGRESATINSPGSRKRSTQLGQHAIGRRKCACAFDGSGPAPTRTAMRRQTDYGAL